MTEPCFYVGCAFGQNLDHQRLSSARTKGMFKHFFSVFSSSKSRTEGLERLAHPKPVCKERVQSVQGHFGSRVAL